MAAHKAMIRISPRECFLVRSTRGAGQVGEVPGEGQIALRHGRAPVDPPVYTETPPQSRVQDA